MNEEQDHFLKLANRYRLIALVSVFVYALLHSLGSIVFWIVGGVAAGAFVLSSYYRRQANPPAQQSTWQRPQFTGGGPTMATSERVQQILKRLPLIVIALIFVSVLWAIFNSKPSTDASQEVEVATDDRTTESNAVNTNPQDADALLNLGNAFFNEQQYDSARFYYDRCLTVDPSYKEALYNIAMSWSNQQNYTEAVSTLQRCLQQNPDYGEAMQLMGNCLYMQDQKDQALQYFQRAYDIGIRNADLSHYLAYLYDLQSDTQKALDFYKEAINQDSSKVEVYKRLAELEPGQADFYLHKAKQWQGN